MSKENINIISIYSGHNSGACLFSNGELIAAISEEKFTNKKNFTGFPKESTSWCAQKVSKVDFIAIAGETAILPDEKIYQKSNLLKDRFKSLIYRFPSKLHTFIHKLNYKKNHNYVKKRFHELLFDYVEPKNIYFLDHHKCHAYAAYGGLVKLQTEPHLVFTLDGYGDFSCATVSISENGVLKEVSRTPMQNSLGAVYGKTTKFLGMKENEHEYKVMGLAPYAKSYYQKTKEKIFDGLLEINNETLEFKSNINTQLTEIYLKRIAVGERFDNLAAALQEFTEELIVDWVKAAIKKYKIQKIVTSGGVFMNVKVNKRLAELKEVKKAYFLPSCGDETLPFGAGYYLTKLKTNSKTKTFNDIYLGISYSNDEVKSFLEKNEIFRDFKVDFVDNIENDIAKLLSNNKIVARFKGKCEFGARSLGNRSILANPSNMESFFKVNDQIKVRDFWMPFAPSIIEENQEEYIHNIKKIDAPYMILGFDTTDAGKNYLRAAMHQADKTVRPQLVSKSTNPSYHKLISSFRDLTGISAVMNTSLNIHGFPLAGTLEQALFTFKNSGLEYLAIENFLIEKKVSNP